MVFYLALKFFFSVRQLGEESGWGGGLDISFLGVSATWVWESVACWQDPWLQVWGSLEKQPIQPAVMGQAAIIIRQGPEERGHTGWQGLRAPSCNRPTHKCLLSDSLVPRLVPGNCCDNTPWVRTNTH